MKSTSAMAFSAALERVITRDLPWALASMLQLLGHRLGTQWTPHPSLAALPAMAKFGLPVPSACFAASAGMRRRPIAQAIGVAFEAKGGGPFPAFLDWLCGLSPEQIGELGLPAEDALRLTDRVGTIAATREALTLLATGEGTVEAPLRGMHVEGRWPRVAALELPADVELTREPDNPHDPNAIAVIDPTGDSLGYVGREYARGIAPLLDADHHASARITDREGDSPDRVGLATVTISVESA